VRHSQIHWQTLRRYHVAVPFLLLLAVLIVSSLVAPSGTPVSAEPSHRYVVFLSGINSSSFTLDRDFGLIKSQLQQDLGISNFVYFSYSAAHFHRSDWYCLAWGGPSACTSQHAGGDLVSLEVLPMYSSSATHLSLKDQADVLDWLLRQIMKRDPLAEIDLVGYSLGGVVASLWAAQAVENGTQADFYKYVHSIVLIESPVGGVPLAGPLLKEECNTGARCLLWKRSLSDWFGKTVLEQLQFPEDDPSKSIVGLLSDAATNPARTFDLTSIQSTDDYLVNGQSIPICDTLLVCITSSLVPVGNGSQHWVGDPTFPQTLHFSQALGGVGMPLPTEPRLLLVPLGLLPSAQDLILTNHYEPLRHPITARWVNEAISDLGGAWISPNNGHAFSGSAHFAAHVYDDTGPHWKLRHSPRTVSHVNFTAWWPSLGPKDSPWITVCTLSSPTHDDVYECDWDFANAPAGDIHISFDVYDKAGNHILSPNTERIIRYTPLAGDWELNYEIYRWLRSDGSTVDVDERATIVTRFSAVENGFTGRYIYVSGNGCINAKIDGTGQGNQVNWKTRFTGPPCQGAEVMFKGTLNPDRTMMTGTVSPVRTSPEGRGAWARVTARKVTSPSVWLNYVSFPSAPHASVAGTKVTATGSGWSAGHKVSVQWGNTQRAAPTVDSNGGFTVSFIVPEDAAEGQHTVHFYDVLPAGGLGYFVPAILTVVKPDIPSLKARVTELLLFESAYDPPPADQRVYAQRFASDTSRYINWELNLEHPAPGRPIDFVITAIWYQDNGTSSWEEIFRQTLDTSIEGEWASSYHNLGYGCDDPVNCWEVGSYRVDLYVAGKMIASAPFQIYSAAL
jgi:hypothetical protein